MTLVVSATIAALFGAGAMLMLRRDLVSVVVGSAVLANAAFLFLVAAGGGPGAAPIRPLPEGDVTDPLVQALALTGIVINLGTTLVLLALVHGAWKAHGTIHLDDLAEAEREDAARSGEPR